MGASSQPKQKRILCMNKVDLVENKKDLLTVAEQFKDLPGYERYYWFLFRMLTRLEVLEHLFSLTEQAPYRYFMISGLKGAGVKDLSKYLIEQACLLFCFTTVIQRNMSVEDFSLD